MRAFGRQAAAVPCEHPHPQLSGLREAALSPPAPLGGRERAQGAALPAGFPLAGCHTAQQRALQRGARSREGALSIRYPDGERALRVSHAAGEERTPEPPFAGSRQPGSAEEPRAVSAPLRAG